MFLNGLSCGVCRKCFWLQVQNCLHTCYYNTALQSDIHCLWLSMFDGPSTGQPLGCLSRAAYYSTTLPCFTSLLSSHRRTITGIDSSTISSATAPFPACPLSTRPTSPFCASCLGGVCTCCRGVAVMTNPFVVWIVAPVVIPTWKACRHRVQKSKAVQHPSACK